MQNFLGIGRMAIALMFFLAAPVCADDVSFEAVVDRNTVELGSFVQLTLTVRGAKNLDPIQLPDLDGFAVRYLGHSTRVSIVNGQTSTSVSYIYNLYPTQTGTLKLPPFIIIYEGQEYQTESITINVIEADSSSQGAASGEQAQVTLKDKIFLRLTTPKREVFVHERVPVTLRLYISNLQVRNIQYPEIQHEGFTIEDYQEPRRGTEIINGRQYQYFDFQTSLYPTQVGQLFLGPAKQICEIVFQGRSRRQRIFGGFMDEDFFDSFFDSFDTRPVTIESNALDIQVQALPTEGRPDGFSGGVGEYEFEVQVSPRQVKVGDPITVRMMLRGQGDLDRIKLPAYDAKILMSKQFKTYEADLTLGEDEKFLEQVIVPKDASVKEVPAIEFSYFDTNQKSYRTIVRGPFDVQVDELAKEERSRVVGLDQDSWGKREGLKEVGRDILFIKKSPGQWQPVNFQLYRRPGFIVSVVIYLGLWAGLYMFHGFRQRLKTDRRFARRLLAPRQARQDLARCREFLKKKDQSRFYDAVFKTLQNYLGNKFHLSPGSVTRQAVETKLTDRNREAGILDKIQQVFEDCEMVRYASIPGNEEAMRQCFRQTEEIIDFFERMGI